MSENYEFRLINDQEAERRRAAERLRLAVAQNVAENGRWFCTLLAIVNVLHGQPLLAIMAVLPIGMSMFVDLMKPGRVRTMASLFVYGFAISTTALSIAIHW